MSSPFLLNELIAALVVRDNLHTSVSRTELEEDFALIRRVLVHAVADCSDRAFGSSPELDMAIEQLMENVRIEKVIEGNKPRLRLVVNNPPVDSKENL